MRLSRSPVLVIAVAQLFGTSLWFMGNAVVADLPESWGMNATREAWLLMVVQLGFILGTCFWATTSLADHLPAPRIFLGSCLVGATSQWAFAHLADSIETALLCRALTGWALAGIYPLGMKLVVSWAPEKAGIALGWLVGALTWGTATPFLLRGFNQTWSWTWTVDLSAALALLGGLLITLLGEGPTPKKQRRLNWAEAWSAFQLPEFRRSALGYFGHMWELYAFWSLVPWTILLLEPELKTSNTRHFWAFLIIAAGGLGCVLGGFLSRRYSSRAVAGVALVLSGSCCVFFPLLVQAGPGLAWVTLFLWGLAVVADSPQFSALSAQAAPAQVVGGALALQNGLGFSLTIISLQGVALCREALHEYIFWILAPGPFLGLYFFYRSKPRERR